MALLNLCWNSRVAEVFQRQTKFAVKVEEAGFVRPKGVEGGEGTGTAVAREKIERRRRAVMSWGGPFMVWWWGRRCHGQNSKEPKSRRSYLISCAVFALLALNLFFGTDYRPMQSWEEIYKSNRNKHFQQLHLQNTFSNIGRRNTNVTISRHFIT